MRGAAFHMLRGIKNNKIEGLTLEIQGSCKKEPKLNRDFLDHMSVNHNLDMIWQCAWLLTGSQIFHQSSFFITHHQ